MIAAKQPLPGYEDARCAVLGRLGPERSPILIVIDGNDGTGKSSFASWLAFQLGMPTLHLDLYMTNYGEWRTEELRAAINSRLDSRRPVIVEGVLALDALDQVGHTADFLIYVRGAGCGSPRLTAKLVEYYSRQGPEQQAQCALDGFVEV